MFFRKNQPSKIPYQKPLRRSWLGRTLLCLALVIILSGLWVGSRIARTSERIFIANDGHTPTWQSIRNLSSLLTPESAHPLQMDQEGHINILLLGIAGERQPGNTLTDTIMIMRIDTKTQKIALLSLPRDLYVTIPGSTSMTKINSLYPIGLKQNLGTDLIRQSVADITGLPIHYFAIVNFAAFQKIIDTLGGISVSVERDLYDARYPGPNYSYETFSLSRGWQTLDGATALKYVRERHADPEGDFGRAKRQQQVIQAVKEKAFSLQTLTNPFAINRLLETLGDNVRTNIPPEELPAFLELSRRLDTRTISNAVVDAWKEDSLLRVSHIAVSNGMMFVLIPRVGNWSEVRDLAANAFDLDNLRRHQAEILRENPRIVIINRSGHPEYTDRFIRLLRDQIGFRQVTASTEKSPPTQTENIIWDQSSGASLWSLDSLMKKLPFRLAENTDTPPTLQSSHPDTALILTLGSDIQQLFRYTDASREEYQNNAADMNYETIIVDPSP